MREVVHTNVAFVEDAVVLFEFLIHFGQSQIETSLQRRANLLSVHVEASFLEDVLDFWEASDLQHLILTLFEHGVNNSEKYFYAFVEIDNENAVDETEWQVAEEEILNDVDEECLFFDIVPIEVCT